MNLTVGQTLDLTIERMTYGANAVARFENIVIFITDCAPGDVVRAEITKKQKNYFEAKLIEVLKPSPQRKTPPCPVFQECGGCQWQHLDYSAQIDAKREILLYQLNRALKKSDHPPATLETISVHQAPSEFEYRARVQAFGDSQGLGFYAKKSHQLIHTDRCLIASPAIQKAWTELTHSKELQKALRIRNPVKIEFTEKPNGTVTKSVDLKSHDREFMQINSDQNEKLKSIVFQIAQKSNTKKTLLDLYGGQGNLSLDLQNLFETIYCIDAKNGGTHPKHAPLAKGHHIIEATTEDFFKNQYWQNWSAADAIPDCIIADPPRQGLRPNAKAIAHLKAPQVILVSCDPSTLARDLEEFLQAGYQIQEAHLMDMFPQTYHIESVISLHLDSVTT